MMGAIAFQKDLGSLHACAHALGAVAAKDFAGQTNPRAATEADYERLFMQAM